MAGKSLIFRLWRAVELVRQAQEEMPAQRISILLLIAQREGITYNELMDQTGLAHSTISRNIAALSAIDRHGNPGLDFVAAVPDLREPRRKSLVLTPKGKRFCRSLEAQLED